MKLHITIEQIKELSNEKLLKLSQLLFSEEIKKIKLDEYHFCGIIKNGNRYLERTEKLICILNIGKMIEILKEESTSLDIEYYFNMEKQWEVVIGYGMGGVEYFDSELVDALWQAVKEVL